MATLPLTKENILNTAEDVILRFGPKKANVQDIARALNVSHPAIYRHYESKAKLWDAVAERWLERISVPRNDILNESISADTKLYRWLVELFESKRKSVINDPELFANYTALVAESSEVLQQHITSLIQDIHGIIIDGINEDIFDIVNPDQTAAAILNAFTRFHHPAHMNKWQNPDINKDFDAVWNLILKGITNR